MDVTTFEHRAGAGWSVHPLPPMDSARTLVLAFGPADAAFAEPRMAELAAAYPSARLLGCSTAGEIHGRQLRDETITVAVTRFAHTRLSQATVHLLRPEGSRAAGRALAGRLSAPDLRAVLVLSDGLSVNGSELVLGMEQVLPSGVMVSGGLAGDGDRFVSTWVADRDGVRAGVVSAVGFHGDAVVVGSGSAGGWDIFGPERMITRAEGNILLELDRRPALELYEEYLGDRAVDLPAAALRFPLCVRPPGGETVVRTILGIDRDRNSLTFAGDVPEGSVAQLMRCNTDRLIDGAADAGAHAARPAVDGDVLSIAVSCVGRRLVLGERVEEEIEATHDGLPTGTHQVGFYSYGEIAPLPSGPVSALHNQTMTVTTISERAAA